MRWVRALPLALASALSPTLGANPREPVLAWALRLLPWRTRRGMLLHGAPALIAGIVAGVVVVQRASGPASPFPGETVLFIAVIARMLSDVMTMTRSAGRLGVEFRSGRWDMLRLTGQGEAAVLRALFVAAHAGAWRLMVMMLGLQIGLLAALGLAARPAAVERAEVWALLLLTAILLGAELALRPRAVAAMTLAASATAPRAGESVLIGGVLLVVYWVAQGVAALAGLLAFTLIFGWFSARWPPFALNALTIAFVAAPAMAVTLLAQRLALQRLVLAVVRHDSGV